MQPRTIHKPDYLLICQFVCNVTQLPRKAAFASLVAKSTKQKIVAVGAHAASDGSNNRAIVMAANEICRRADAKLILSLDANSAAYFNRADVDKGSATQAIFDAHVR
eukprot:SAG31_NODE_409_length_16006_cov_10.345760_4_plen_107_part_00